MEVCQGSNPHNNSPNKVHRLCTYKVIQKYNLNYKSYILQFTNTQVCSKSECWN